LTFARASNVLKKILANLSGPLTPQNIREQIKKDYSEYYRTPADIRNVAKGYYKDLDHATLAQIYNRVGNNKSFTCDKTKTPMEISLSGNEKAPDDKKSERGSALKSERGSALDIGQSFNIFVVQDKGRI
jgi:hypothetical protein